MEKAKGGGNHRSHHATGAPALADIGISKTNSSRWQMLATVPEDSYGAKRSIAPPTVIDAAIPAGVTPGRNIGATTLSAITPPHIDLIAHRTAIFCFPALSRSEPSL